VADASFTLSDDQLVVRIWVPVNLALLIENAFDSLRAILVAHDKRVKAVGLMLTDPLLSGSRAQYFVVISLTSPLTEKAARLLVTYVARWKRKTLHMAA
jgi:hypothetical protein